MWNWLNQGEEKKLIKSWLSTIFPGYISQQKQSDKQIRGLDKLLNPLNHDLFGAEGRICKIVNNNNKLLNYKWVYVSLNEFLYVPGRIIAYW